MIACKHCNTPNSLDSTFCKRCGTPLPEDDLAAARAELEKIVAEGFTALAANKVEEAFAIAESSVMADPSSTQALTLKSACHERRGEIPEALECAERLVELNPNSELDKIRRNQLRSALASMARNRPYPSRGIAVLGGVSVGVIIACCGIVIARGNPKEPADTRVATNQAAAIPAGVTTPSTTSQPQAQASAPTGAQDQSQKQPADTPAQTQPADSSKAPGQVPGAEPPVHRPGVSSSRVGPLPSVTGGGDDVKPLEAGAPVPIPAQTPPANQTKAQSGDPQPQPETAAPAQDPGQIDIRVHNSGPLRIRASGSQAAGSSPNSAKAFEKAAENEYLVGNYGGAAIHLEQALQSGGDPVTVNERLGMAYNNLGRKSDAVTAYKRALDAVDAAIKSGRGDTSRLQKIKSACESQVAVLQSGQ
jgi:tetratricopeptide (TPR) repeat protein